MIVNDANHQIRERSSVLDAQIAVLAFIFFVVADAMIVRLNLI